MRSTRPFACNLAACSLAACASIASARSDPGALAIEVTQTPGAIALAPPSQTHADPATQTMLWNHRGAVGFGVGVEQRNPPLQGPGLQPRVADSILVGVSFATGERTQLSWQTSASDMGGTTLADRPMKVSLTFHRSDTLRDLQRGSLMRMELSGQTTLALKARGGKLGFALTSRW